ncbi:xanthine dehydrogenase family protein molybdopterin-binding subunit [Occallatibacter riparius]|uniref:Xanthine dehydrogenase family protein molybdopterin-binding subunit n=1 Tax=Occallatibacter riparius TaxID=1002689 RepID=A0A9J7BMF5_9BACT|nr:xanthine dehydrogenase family protein molybdopterin-binding subunit [Occallatibacter riparius]UWZ83681.1 xanthine dehydrogenase family protein molybdopterin-binding subunit [Occallatibacter riparius]
MSTTPASMAAIIGKATPRIDGPLKTTGAAEYSADFHFDRMVHAVPVSATIGNGRITKLDTSAAESMPGVLLVLHHGNIGPLYRTVPGDDNATNSEVRSAFEDETIRYFGQYVAVVVAETLEQATAAASAVKAEYAAETPNVSTKLGDYDGKRKSTSKRGDPDGAFASAPVKLDAVYNTPVETHNPIELHASVAVWDGDNVTMYETSQGVVNHRVVMAQTLGLPVENVRVITRYLGSGFGGKLFPWPHAAMTAVAARKLGRPVKLSVTRRMMFSCVGYRPHTEQHVKIGATKEGKLLALRHDYFNNTSMLDDFDEGCGEATPILYSVANLEVTSAQPRRNMGAPMWMRGPGAVPGLYALESAMNELADQLNMDPLQLRILNDTEKDESNKDIPFSSRHLRECYEVGAKKFGWERRTTGIGSMRRDGKILGWGMGGASWVAIQLPCTAVVEFCANGRLCVRCGTQDIGTGTYTVFAQVLHEKTGVPLEKIDVILGDSGLPGGPMSGGSMVTGSVLDAIANGANGAIKRLQQIAASTDGSPLKGASLETIALTGGRLHTKSQAYTDGAHFADILSAAKLARVSAEGKTTPSWENPKSKGYSLHSFGAQFVEVEYDPEIARVRVSRVVSVIDGGRIINPKAATNQIAGAVVMGVGMGLLEETVYDHRTGQPINGSLADYLVATCADAPDIDVTFLDHPDPIMGEYGARGIAEIGLAGVAPAITAAVYHATGVRVRDLPVRIEDLLQSKVV